jgi:hypothetical protein
VPQLSLIEIAGRAPELARRSRLIANPLRGRIQ